MVMTPVQLLPVSRVFAALCPRESNETETEVDLPRPRGMEEQENRSGVTPRSAAPREVHVSGVAELSAAPDRARVSVCLSSCKETANDAKSSVNRRLEYILQSMRQHGVQEENLTVTKTFRRRENAYNMEVEICVIFEDFEKMQTISNLLVEKLDISVTISPPHFYHSPESVEALRRRVCLAAVGNARRKAQEVCRLVGQTLGKPLLIREDEMKEWECQADHQHDGLSIQQKIKNTTISAASKIFATFEIKGKEKHKKMFN
ncbi:interleukin-1 receptor-associated kinase 1-binding protein 1 [Pleurodeles waltl]|uniref:interleukin-1 receptor-associated kinase 1-binding protein 1 n=1 Tax=Pleurodeles waltl TaxID=8319 RepID=UPI0037094747